MLYNMAQPDHKYSTSEKYTGKAIIICNCEFEKHGDRGVARQDVEKLQTALKNLGFTLDIYWNQTSKDILSIMREAAEQDYSHYDCFLCILSSHGAWESPNNKVIHDVVIGSDGSSIDMRTVCNTMLPRHCPSMENKPKLFLFQFCRGNRFTTSIGTALTMGDGAVVDARRSEFKGAGIEQVHGSVDLAPEEYNIPYHVPIKKDYFLHYATTPGYVSWKYKKGTPFLQAWADVLNDSELTGVNNIAVLGTMINRRVAENYESYAPSSAEKGFDKRREMPQIISMLTKDFYFVKKI